MSLKYVSVFLTIKFQFSNFSNFSFHKFEFFIYANDLKLDIFHNYETSHSYTLFEEDKKKYRLRDIRTEFC